MTMRLKRLFRRARAGRWACLVLAACLVAAPLAGEAAAEIAAETECAAADAAAAADEAGPRHADGDHDHHAHSCGGCHLHFLNVRLTAPSAARRVTMRRLPMVSEAPRDAPPPGLFRPPRA